MTSLFIQITLKESKFQLMILEKVRSERETETFADFPLSQLTVYLVTHNESQRNQQPHQN